MPKPQTNSVTVTGTRGADVFNLAAGVLEVNGSPKSIAAETQTANLSGGAGDDIFRTDTPHASNGTAFFYDGGRGNDTLDFSASSQAVAVRLYGSTQTVSTNFSMVSVHDDPATTGYYDPNDPKERLVLSGATTTGNVANFESVIGSAFDDYLGLSYAAAGYADGGLGNDWIEGGIGNDMLFGGAGNDYIEGRAGNDTMTGGTGADQFQVLTMNGDEVITDFNIAEGDWLFIAQQEPSHAVPTASSWYQTTYTDANGVIHVAIRANFEGGSVTLVDLTLADVSSVMAQSTTYDWFG